MATTTNLWPITTGTINNGINNGINNSYWGSNSTISPSTITGSAIYPTTYPATTGAFGTISIPSMTISDVATDPFFDTTLLSEDENEIVRVMKEFSKEFGWRSSVHDRYQIKLVDSDLGDAKVAAQYLGITITNGGRELGAWINEDYASYNAMQSKFVKKFTHDLSNPELNDKFIEFITKVDHPAETTFAESTWGYNDNNSFSVYPTSGPSAYTLTNFTNFTP